MNLLSPEYNPNPENSQILCRTATITITLTLTRPQVTPTVIEKLRMVSKKDPGWTIVLARALAPQYTPTGVPTDPNPREGTAVMKSPALSPSTLTRAGRYCACLSAPLLGYPSTPVSR